MENASKALIIAGSLLISLLVISGLTFMYGQLVGFEQTKTDVDEASKMTDYGKKFEAYNKTLYGSELLSLANLQDDYNRTQTGAKGYDAVTIKITTKGISATTYFSAGTKDISAITKDKNDVEDLIRQFEDANAARKAGKLYKNRVVKYYAQITNREIANIYKDEYKVEYSSSETDHEIGDKLQAQGGEIGRLLRDIDDYRSIKAVYTEFKMKIFRCTNVGYGATGRVNSMTYAEI